MIRRAEKLEKEVLSLYHSDLDPRSKVDFITQAVEDYVTEVKQKSITGDDIKRFGYKRCDYCGQIIVNNPNVTGQFLYELD